MSTRAVLDASAAVRIALGGPGCDELAAFLDECSQVLAPTILTAEVANAIWKYTTSGTLSLAEAQERMNEALLLAEVLVPDAGLVEEALAAAADLKHPAYDLLYAVLARRKAATLVTADRALARLLGRMHVAAYCPEEPPKPLG
ncbi:MAG TPA: type II toxin-antitoxin system VapC family toxin [Thermoanaerobaculia bacterium]|nr:type II toxin-antitoxin system VapC family toxin [Thermoanaerobaculia bacterium]